MKKNIFALFIVLSVLTLCVSCAPKEGTVEEEPDSSVDSSVANQIDPDSEIIVQPEPKGVSFDEEEEGATIVKVKTDPSMFVGRWKSTSDRADYLYGNVDLKINEDGTWSADITGEKLKGKWKDMGDYLHMTNDLFSFNVFFNEKGHLLMEEVDSEGNLYTVLTRQ